MCIFLGRGFKSLKGFFFNSNYPIRNAFQVSYGDSLNSDSPEQWVTSKDFDDKSSHHPTACFCFLINYLYHP